MNQSKTPRPYPVHFFPEIFQAVDKQIRSKVRQPPSLPPMLCLAAFSSVLQNLYDLRSPKGVCPTSVFVCPLVPGGVGKSFADDEIAKILHELDKQMGKEADLLNARHRDRLRMWKARLKKLESQLACYDLDGPLDEQGTSLLQARDAHLAQEPKEPDLRPFLLGAMSERAFRKRFNGEDQAATVWDPEGGTVFESEALNVPGLFNDGFSGRPLRDSKGSKHSAAYSPRLTVMVMVQTAVFAKLMLKGADQLRDVGLASRILWAWSTAEDVEKFEGEIDAGRDALAELQSMLAEYLVSARNKNIVKTILEFDEEATTLFWRLDGETIQAMQPGNEMFDIADCARRRIEITIRVAALLHIVEKRVGKISSETLSRANEIVLWHVYQFRKIFLKEVPDFQFERDKAKVQIYVVRQFAETKKVYFDFQHFANRSHIHCKSSIKGYFEEIMLQLEREKIIHMQLDYSAAGKRGKPTRRVFLYGKGYGSGSSPQSELPPGHNDLNGSNIVHRYIKQTDHTGG